jgi:hypothetical protein
MRKTLKLIDAVGAEVDFLNDALQVEQTDAFKHPTPPPFKGFHAMRFIELKGKNGKLEKDESTYLGLLYSKTIEKLLLDSVVHAEHSSGEQRQIFVGETLPSSNGETFRRHWKRKYVLELTVRLANREDPYSAPEPMIVVVTDKEDRCKVIDIKWNGIHFTEESKLAFEGRAAVAAIAASDEGRERSMASTLGREHRPAALEPNDAELHESEERANEDSDDEIVLSDPPSESRVAVAVTAASAVGPAAASSSDEDDEEARRRFQAPSFAKKAANHAVLSDDESEEDVTFFPDAHPPALLVWPADSDAAAAVTGPIVTRPRDMDASGASFAGDDEDVAADDDDDDGGLEWTSYDIAVDDDDAAGGPAWTSDDEKDERRLANEDQPPSNRIDPGPEIVDPRIAAADAARDEPAVAVGPVVDPDQDATGPPTTTSVADRALASGGGHPQAPKYIEREEEEQSLASESKASVDDLLCPEDVGVVPSWSLSEEDKSWVDRTILLLLDSAEAAFPLDEMDIRRLISYASRTMACDARSLTLESPITICGDLHGHFTNLRNALTVGEKLTEVSSFSRRFTGLDIEPLRLSLVLSCPSTLAQDALPRQLRGSWRSPA